MTAAPRTLSAQESKGGAALRDPAREDWPITMDPLEGPDPTGSPSQWIAGWWTESCVPVSPCVGTQLLYLEVRPGQWLWH